MKSNPKNNPMYAGGYYIEVAIHVVIFAETTAQCDYYLRKGHRQKIEYRSYYYDALRSYLLILVAPTLAVSVLQP